VAQSDSKIDKSLSNANLIGIDSTVHRLSLVEHRRHTMDERQFVLPVQKPGGGPSGVRV
jgi:hypothetical protein